MDNVFMDTSNSLDDVNVSLSELESVVSNLSELVWSIDLTQEPYQIKYHNYPKEGSAKSAIFVQSKKVS